jgi:predicted TIM-barrel fold metal-dependent hydrolase
MTGAYLMVQQGFRVIDSDLHLVEPADLWEHYIEPKFRDRAPKGARLPHRWKRDINLLVNGRLPRPAYIPTEKWALSRKNHTDPLDASYEFAAARDWDGMSQLEAMAKEGIDLALLFPSRGLFALGVDSTESIGPDGLEPALATAIARAYNDWLYDFCAPDRTRLIGAAMVAPHDVDAAVDETRRCVEDLGFKSIFLKPGFVNHRPWHDRYYDPLWAECERLSIPVAFHGAMDQLLQDFGQGLHEHFFMFHTFEHPMGPMVALVSMIGGGVFDRFPQLRAAFLEGNCGWAPWLIGRLHDQYEYMGCFENPLELEPAEYFVRNCTVAVEADEKAVAYCIMEFGDDNIVFSTDYPHPDSKFPHAVSKFLKLPISERSKRKILWDNCIRLYGITAEAERMVGATKS